MSFPVHIWLFQIAPVTYQCNSLFTMRLISSCSLQEKVLQCTNDNITPHPLSPTTYIRQPPQKLALVEAFGEKSSDNSLFLFHFMPIMNYLFSTEDMETSVSVFVESLSEGFVADVESSNFKSQSDGFSSIFTGIPFWTDFYIRLCLMSVIIVLNALIILHYSKDRGSIRSYVLALALLDIFVAFTNIVTSLLQLIDNTTLDFFLGITRFSASGTVFNIYLYPSLFLALDRCIAVAFPHKAFALTPKVRPAKFFLVVLNLSATIPHICSQLGLTSKLISLITNLATLLFFCIQLFGCLFLYCAVVILLLKSGRSLNQSKHG